MRQKFMWDMGNNDEMGGWDELLGGAVRLKARDALPAKHAHRRAEGKRLGYQASQIRAARMER